MLMLDVRCELSYDPWQGTVFAGCFLKMDTYQKFCKIVVKMFKKKLILDKGDLFSFLETVVFFLFSTG